MDELRLSGGGTTAVATDSMFAEIARLGSVAAIVDEWRRRLDVIRAGVDEHVDWAPLRVTSPSSLLGGASVALRAAVDEAAALGSALEDSAERYGATERFLAALWSAGHRLGAFQLGMMLPLLVVPTLVVGGVALVGAARLRLLVGPERADAALARALADSPELLSDPAFVQLVGAVADSTDEFVAGLLRLPGLLAVGGAVGAPESAELLLAAISVASLATGGRALVETAVRVRQVPTPGTGPDAASAAGTRAAAIRAPDAAPPPRGVADLAARIPPSVAGEPQIRIERYGPPDAPKWVVYSSGTIDFTVVPGAETHDMTSNLHAVADSSVFEALRAAGPDGGAGERALREAMAAAGIRPGDPFLAVGHSAGGIAAANIAADSELNGHGAINFGGPTAQVDMHGTPLLSVEHDQDLVPRTAGAGHPSPDRLVVHADVGDALGGSREVVPAHAMTLYRQTAGEIDTSAEARLQEWSARVRDFTGGGAAEVTYWHAQRVAPAEGTGGPATRAR